MSEGSSEQPLRYWESQSEKNLEEQSYEENADEELEDTLLLKLYTGELDKEQPEANDVNLESSSADSSGPLLIPIVSSLKNEEDGEFELDDRILPSSMRYYTPENSRITCFNCGGQGHIAVQCIQEKKVQPCFLCGELGHQRKECPKDLCFKCSSTGHLAKDCRARNKGVRDFKCSRCGQHGHLKWECSTDISLRQPLSKRPLSCFNCGEYGHPGIECDRDDIEQSLRQLDRSVLYDSRLRAPRRKSRFFPKRTPEKVWEVVSDSEDSEDEYLSRSKYDDRGRNSRSNSRSDSRTNDRYRPYDMRDRGGSKRDNRNSGSRSEQRYYGESDDSWTSSSDFSEDEYDSRKGNRSNYSKSSSSNNNRNYRRDSGRSSR